jgi:hypothetical protein
MHNGEHKAVEKAYKELCEELNAISARLYRAPKDDVEMWEARYNDILSRLQGAEVILKALGWEDDYLRKIDEGVKTAGQS